MLKHETYNKLKSAELLNSIMIVFDANEKRHAVDNQRNLNRYIAAGDFLIDLFKSLADEVGKISERDIRLQIQNSKRREKVVEQIRTLERLAEGTKTVAISPSNVVYLYPEELETYFFSTSSTIKAHLAKIGEKYQKIQEFHGLTKSQLELWHILLISVLGIGTAIVTGGLLAPVIIPAVAGIVGGGIAGATIGIAATSTVAGVVSSAVSSVTTSIILEEDVNDSAERSLISTAKGAMFGAMGGGLAGAVTPGIVNAVGQGIAASALVGGVAGGGAGLAQGAYQVCQDIDLYETWPEGIAEGGKTLLTHTLLGVGVGAAAGAVAGIIQQPGTIKQQNQDTSSVITKQPALSAPSVATSQHVPTPHMPVIVDDSSAAASAASTNMTNLSNLDRKKLSSDFDHKITDFMNQYRLSAEGKADLAQCREAAKTKLRALRLEDSPEVSYQEIRARLLAANVVQKPSVTSMQGGGAFQFYRDGSPILLASKVAPNIDGQVHSFG